MASRRAYSKYPEDHCNPLNVDLNAPPINPEIDKIVHELTNPKGHSEYPAWL